MLGRDRSRSHADADGRLGEGSLAHHPSFLLARANARSLTLGNAALAPFELKVRSYSVLALAAGDDRPSQRDLASFLRLDPSQVVVLVDDLEQRGLVERTADPTDRRANSVVATPAGKDVAVRAAAALSEVQDVIFSSLDPAEREALTELLRRVAFWD